jgi:hypothetical protein
VGGADRTSPIQPVSRPAAGDIILRRCGI